ncbi:MAG TPA: hypothetical protein VFD88_02650 [Clostridia bacterium]|nr:hypothetical protein [Clostridia bacterium]
MHRSLRSRCCRLQQLLFAQGRRYDARHRGTGLDERGGTDRRRVGLYYD